MLHVPERRSRRNEMVRQLFAYKFKSPLTMDEIRNRLNGLGLWKWHERDNDRWGPYTSAAPVADVAQVKILTDPADLDWYAVNVSFKSERPTAAADFQNLRHLLFTRMLPAIQASRLTETDDYE